MDLFQFLSPSWGGPISKSVDFAVICKQNCQSKKFTLRVRDLPKNPQLGWHKAILF